MLEAFAASAATGVATARSMAEERLQNTIDAAEQERSRWARELHDETLQALAVLRMRLLSALREESPEDLHATGQEAVEQIDDEIVKLRRLITELRPASLDTIGLEAALQALARAASAGGRDPEVDCDFELPREEDARPTPAARDGRLPAGPGGAQQRLQALDGAAGGAHGARLRGRSRSRSRTTGSASSRPGPRGIRPRRHARAGGAARWHAEYRFHAGGRDHDSARRSRSARRPRTPESGRGR